MTMPTGSDPSGFDLTNVDGPVVGAGLSALAQRTEENVRASKSAEVKNDPGLKAWSDLVFEGIDAELGIVLGPLKALVQKMFPGLNLSGIGSTSDLLGLIEKVPVIGDIVAFILGDDGDESTLATFFTNLRAFLPSTMKSGSFNLLTAGEEFISNILKPAGLLSEVENLVETLMSSLGLNPGGGSLLDKIGSLSSSLGGRIQDTEDNIGDFLDSLWGGLQRKTGTGKSAADVGNAAITTSMQAATGVQIGEWNNAVLNLRNNKSLMQGIDETEEANFSVGQLWAGTTTEPVGTVSATAASVPVAYWRASEVAKKGFISWFGKGFTGITSLNIDVYRANYTTNTWDLIHTSPNLIAQVDNTWRYLIYSIANVTDRIGVVSGDVLGVAWRVTGSGTHTIAAIPASGMPQHPTIHPKTPASTRTGVGALAFASTAYATTIPWFGIGIITGDAPAPYYAPRQTIYGASDTYTIPAEFRVQGNILDIVAIGSGSGGDGSIAYVPAPSGLPGQWAARRYVYGVDIPMGTTSLAISIGPRGTGGVGSFGGIGTDGAATTVSAPGMATLTAPGGSGQAASPNNTAAGTYDFQGTTYQGGAATGLGSVGNTPGGGGGGGLPYLSGKDGANGGAWITVHQP